MQAPGGGDRWRLAAGAAFLGMLFFFPGSPARAASTIDVGDQAVIQVWARGQSDVTVRTWERAAIQIESDDEQIAVQKRVVVFGTAQNPMLAGIPPTPIRIRDAAGNVTTTTLPPEDFPYAADMRPGPHDAVRISAGEGTHTTVTVPAGTAIVDARVFGVGNLAVSNVRSGTLFAMSGGGRVALDGINAATFIQALNGKLSAVDCTFDRLRARGNTTTMVFERVHARQIEVTTHSGPIVFDNGSFDAGLARFETTNAPIAIGVANSAQVAAHSQEGRVFQLWDRRTSIEQRTENEATAIVGSGGPIVNALSVRGNLFLYDGSLATRHALPETWRRIPAALRAAAGGFAGGTAAGPGTTDPNGGSSTGTGGSTSASSSTSTTTATGIKKPAVAKPLPALEPAKASTTIKKFA